MGTCMSGEARMLQAQDKKSKSKTPKPEGAEDGFGDFAGE